METIEKIKEEIKKYDWYYSMSDSHGVWQAGQKHTTEIKSLIDGTQDPDKIEEIKDFIREDFGSKYNSDPKNAIEVFFEEVKR